MKGPYNQQHFRSNKLTARSVKKGLLIEAISLNIVHLSFFFFFFFADEANAFIKANEQRGKTLETTYEHVREQDLNDIEALVRIRKGSL